MKGSQISYLWKNPDAARSFNTGVSLHSHTNRSRETLDFVVKVLASDGFFGRLFQRLESMHARHSVVKMDFASAWPLTLSAVRSRTGSTAPRWFPSPTTTTSKRLNCCVP